MIRILAFLCILMPTVCCWAAPPQGFEAHSGTIAQPPADLKPMETSPSMTMEQRLERLNTQVAHIDSFLETGGRYASLATEITHHYESYLNLIIEQQAHCDRSEQEIPNKDTFFSGLYRGSIDDCRETVEFMNRQARDLAVEIDEVISQARELEGALQKALSVKEIKLLEKALYDKQIQLRRSLEEARQADEELKKAYREMIKR
jgi:hypothetical protein